MTMVAERTNKVKDILTSEIQISLARLLDLNGLTDIRSQKLRLIEIERLFINLEELKVL